MKYCSAIDCGLHVDFAGNVRTCCSGGFPFGNLNQNSLGDIRQRQKLTTEYCVTCDRDEEISPKSSQRHSFNDMYTVRDNNDIKLIDIRWSNTCNLTCRYCDSGSSSKWRNVLGLKSYNNNFYTDLLEELKQHVDTIDRVFLVGGEPLLQKPNLKFLDMLQENCSIDVITNASTHFGKNKIYNKLKRFKNINWNLSFDNVADRFEYVRAGGDWSRLQKNIQLLVDDFGIDNITFHPIYTLWNCTRLQEYYEFRDSVDPKLNVNWQPGFARHDALSSDGFLVQGHSEEIIELALREIDSLDLNNHLIDGIEFLQDTKQFLLKQVPNPNKAEIFTQWIDRIESLVPPKKPFRLLWPELYSIIVK